MRSPMVFLKWFTGVCGRIVEKRDPRRLDSLLCYWTLTDLDGLCLPSKIMARWGLALFESFCMVRVEKMYGDMRILHRPEPSIYGV